MAQIKRSLIRPALAVKVGIRRRPSRGIPDDILDCGQKCPCECTMCGGGSCDCGEPECGGCDDGGACPEGRRFAKRRLSGARRKYRR